MTWNSIQRLPMDTLRFRESINSLLSDIWTEPLMFCDHLYEVWLAVSRLYLDQVEIHKCTIDDLEAGMGVSGLLATANRVDELAATESQVRVRLRTYLEQLTIWDCYDAKNAIPISRGLKSKEDYIGVLALHLPEVYAETIRLEHCAHKLLADPSKEALSQAIVSAEHLGKNHISYVLPALEWLTDCDAWQ